jgi:uncharacterized protein (TIGR02145 family)
MTFNFHINELLFCQKLKSKLNWLNGTEGTNSIGFNAILSGRRELGFNDVSKNVFYWTTNENKSKYAFAF